MVAYSFKEQFVRPIALGLGHQLCRGIEIPETIKPKRQTIRAIGKRRHARPGEVVQLYHAMRTKQCFQIGVGRCTNVFDIRISVAGAYIELDGERHRYRNWLDKFASRDGFASWSEMRSFWRDNHGTEIFDGLLIEWEPIR